MATIRRALAQDEAAILPLLRAYCDEVGTDWQDEHLLEGLSPIVADEQIGDVLVADQSGDLIGYLVMTWGWGIESGGREALIDEMYVVPAQRHAGVGTLLMTSALTRAQERETKVVFLETEQDNPESRALYDRLGFEIESSIWMSRKL